jgi:hypothetical protein
MKLEFIRLNLHYNTQTKLTIERPTENACFDELWRLESDIRFNANYIYWIPNADVNARYNEYVIATHCPAA